MGQEILKKHMMNFPTEALKCFLGEDLVESLFEWHSGTDAFFTKTRLSDMILNIYGLSILRNKEFRIQLFKVLPPDEILEFRVDLPNKYKDCQDISKIIEVVSNTSWCENKINIHLLRLLSYSESDIFVQSEPDTESIVKVSSYDKFYELLDYQYIIRQKALNILNSPYGLRRFLIHMPTGTGKTKTAMHIICHHYNFNLKKEGLVIWIAHTTELLEQAYNTFISVWKHIGSGDINIYKLWGNRSIDVVDRDLSGMMICGIQKLQSIMNNDTDLFDKLVSNACLIVYDEAHKASASETKRVIEHFMTRREEMPDRTLMGLSATPGRTTEISFDNDILVSMFGNRIISIDTKLMNAVNMSAQEAINADVEPDIIKYFQKRGILSKIVKEELTYSHEVTKEEIKKIRVITTANGYDDFSTATLEMIGKNRNRNLVILQKLRELNVKKKPTIVFACSVKHGQLLSSMLTLEGIPNALVIGDMAPVDRKNAIASFKDSQSDMNILINYEVLTTGFDAVNIECVFIARPTQSVVLYSQMLGRGLRGPQMGGKEECLLIDIKDNLEQFNENMAFSHFNNYWNA